MELKKRVTSILRELNVNPANKGYGHLREAIILCVENDEYIHNMTKKLYPCIAKNNDSTASRVERTIRHAIEESICIASQESLAKYIDVRFKKEVFKPTNGQYIAAVVDYINIFCK